MLKTRIIEVLPQPAPFPPKENVLGYTILGEAAMKREVPVPDAKGNMPPPLLIRIGSKQFFVIGYTWDIPELGDEYDPSEAIYVMIVQAVPEMPSGLVRADAGTMSQIEKVVPLPGSKRQ